MPKHFYGKCQLLIFSESEIAKLLFWLQYEDHNTFKYMILLLVKYMHQKHKDLTQRIANTREEKFHSSEKNHDHNVFESILRVTSI